MSFNSLSVQAEDHVVVKPDGGYKKTKDRVKKKSVLERVFGNKDVVKEHYFSSGEQINDENERNILEETSPFIYPKDFDEFSFKVLSNAWKEKLRHKELKYKCTQRNNYRSRQQLDTLNRLYVKEPDQQSMRTILDIDPDFFTIVQGRPIKASFDIKEYVTHMREVLRAKIVTGFRDDEVMLIHENYMQEQRVIDEIKGRYQKYVDAFEEFIYNDHTTAMDLLKEAEKEANLSFAKYDQFRELSLDFGALKSQVYNLEEKWRNCKMYQKFLYVVSPISWRQAHDYYNFGENVVARDESSVFGRYKLLSADDNMSLEDLIGLFNEDVRTQDDPLLFFTTPQQLLKVFKFIELQNLNSLLHAEELAIPLENIKIGMNNARLKFDEEIDHLQEIIGSLEGDIIWEEKRASHLHTLAMNLIHGEFEKFISADEVLNLYVYVEDTYENALAPNDANLSILEMMRAIEILYRSYVLDLDYLPQDKVQKAEMDCYQTEARTMKIAQEAAKKVVQIERQAKRLARVLEPPCFRTKKEMVWRSAPIDHSLKTKVEIKPLTAAENQFLEYFTDFCKHTDNPEDYMNK